MLYFLDRPLGQDGSGQGKICAVIKFEKERFLTYSLNSHEKDEGRQLISLLTSLAEIMTVRQGEELQLAEAGRSLYFVLRGRVEVSYVAEDTKIIVAMIGGGNFFGEIGFFDGISRLRNMRAFEETEVLVFAYETLRQLEKDDPPLFIRLLLFAARSICRKFRALVEEHGSLPAYSTLFENRQTAAEPQPLAPHFFRTAVGKEVFRLVETLKAELFDVSHRLQEEAAPDIPPPLASLCFAVLDQFYGQLITVFSCQDYETEEAAQAWSYLFKEIFPYFMRSRFAERIYYKPKGYASDFMTVEMVYRNEPDGDGKLGRLVDEWCLRSKAAQAIRDRRRLLAGQLRDIAATRRQQDGIRFMSLACGSGRELFDFLDGYDFSEKIEAFCVDIDIDALHFIARVVDTFPHRAAIRLMHENIVKWSLGRVKHDLGLFDCIYTTSLADYLDDRLFKSFINRCHKHLQPDGILVLCNFAPNPDQLFMNNILQWPLICRTSDQLRQLFAETRFGNDIEIHTEAGGVDYLVRATRKA